MSKKNTELWDRLFTSDPDETKPFKRGGGFSGTAIRPYWVIGRMTEEFGPMGKGWGARETDHVVHVHLDGQAVWCSKVQLWWMENQDQPVPYLIEQWGQTMMVVKRASGDMFFDEEAPKKAFTDGLAKCCSYLGLGGDVHMGLFDDSKYVAELKLEKRKEREKEEREERKERQEKKPPKVEDDAEDRDQEEVKRTPKAKKPSNEEIAERERKRYAEKEKANGEDVEQPDEKESFDPKAWAAHVEAMLPKLEDEQAVRGYWSTKIKPVIDDLVKDGDKDMIEFCKVIHGKVKDRLASVR
jgi:hypothetical protein